jgi:hypothetical protein
MFSARYVHVGQHPGSVPDTHMLGTAFRFNFGYVHVDTEPECCNLHVLIRHWTWMLYLTCTFPALNLNAVTYMYVSGFEPQWCNLHVGVRHWTCMLYSAGNVHVRYSIQVQCRISTCKLQHSGSVSDTYMSVTVFQFSASHLHVSYSIEVQYRIRTCKLQHRGSVPNTYM